jgi:hypothetical protein
VKSQSYNSISQDAQELLQTVFAMLAKDSEKRRRSRPINKPSLGNIAYENVARPSTNDNPFEGWITRYFISFVIIHVSELHHGRHDYS